jgi:beta-galactosidase
VKKGYQYIKIKSNNIASGQLMIENNYSFTNLNEFNIKYEIVSNNSLIQEGSLTHVDVAPYQKKEFVLPINRANLAKGDEYILNVWAETKTANLVLDKNYRIAKEQFVWSELAMEFAENDESDQPLTINETQSDIEIFGSDFMLRFSKKSGFLTSYVYQGVDLIKNNLQPDFWRSPTNNDRGNKLQDRCAIWRNMEDKRTDISLKIVDTDGRSLKLECTSKLPEVKASYFLTYCIYADGKVNVSALYETTATNIPEIPRFGMNLTLPGEFNQLSWYGRGPFENYCDRNTAAWVGWYRSKVNNLHVPYIFPQENGYKTDIRWMAIQDIKGRGFLIVGDQLLSGTAHHYNKYDLDNKLKHEIDVPIKDYTVINIDYKQMGVGGDNTWGYHTHDKYKLLEKKYNYSFSLIPINCHSMEVLNSIYSNNKID